MRAAWYDRQGPAHQVLEVGELPAPAPAPGEVRVDVRFSGVNPGDTKKRGGWLGSSMAFPLVVPHSDGAGVIDEVGAGVDTSRIGERVWGVGRAVLPSLRHVGRVHRGVRRLRRRAAGRGSDEVAACLGIPGITAHRAVFGDGADGGATVLVHGVRGAVGSLAAQLARWRGATVIGTVRQAGDVDGAANLGIAHVVALDAPDVTAHIQDAAPGGVDRIIEVSLSDNVDLDAEVLRVGGVIAAYASRDGRPSVPF